MESVPLMWGPVTASPVGIEPMTILEGGGGAIDGWRRFCGATSCACKAGWNGLRCLDTCSCNLQLSLYWQYCIGFISGAKRHFQSMGALHCGTPGPSA